MPTRALQYLTMVAKSVAVLEKASTLVALHEIASPSCLFQVRVCGQTFRRPRRAVCNDRPHPSPPAGAPKV